MLIGEFAQKAGVSVDTVRFYVRKGLLDPKVGRLGGRNPYKIFTEQDLEHIRLLRLGQLFGQSLKELGELKLEIDAQGGLSREREIEINRSRLAELEARLKSLTLLVGYLREKVEWMENGEIGPSPSLTLR